MQKKILVYLRNTDAHNISNSMYIPYITYIHTVNDVMLNTSLKKIMTNNYQELYLLKILPHL